jgi:hypothetical protein
MKLSNYSISLLVEEKVKKMENHIPVSNLYWHVSLNGAFSKNGRKTH